MNYLNLCVEVMFARGFILFLFLSLCYFSIRQAIRFPAVAGVSNENVAVMFLCEKSI